MLALSLLAPLLLACAPPEALDCQVELGTGAPTATVGWRTEEPASGVVAYGIDGAQDTMTAAVTTTQHAHLLLGLPPDMEVSWQAAADGRTCQGSFWTEPLPSWVATAQVVAGADEGAGAWLAVVTELATRASQVQVFDRQGVVRWHHQAQDERLVVDLQPAVDGSGVLYDQFHDRFTEDVAVVRHLGWDGQLLAETPLTMGHHMFAQLPDGVLAYQALDVRPWTDPDTGDELSLVGDAIVEIDADGQSTQVFSVWDWLEVQPNGFSNLPSIYPQGIDWTHGNALKYDEADDSWLLSLGNAGTVMTIDRATGEPLRTVGAYGLPVADGSPALEHQHDPTWLSDDRLLVFDSHFDDFVSGAYEYALVDDQLELVWSHQSRDELFALILGQAQRDGSGGTWVNYGSAGVIEQLDASGALAWRVELGSAHGFGQVRWLPDFPLP